MKLGTLRILLEQHSPELEVVISSQGETTQIPLTAEVEYSHIDDKPFLRLYTDNGEDKL